MDYHTDYVVYQRIKETDTTKSSPASEGTEFTTCYSLNGYVAVKGKLVSGQTLTAYTDAVTPFGAECDYIWKRNGRIISGATDDTYVFIISYQTDKTSDVIFDNTTINVENESDRLKIFYDTNHVTTCKDTTLNTISQTIQSKNI